MTPTRDSAQDADAGNQPETVIPPTPVADAITASKTAQAAAEEAKAAANAAAVAGGTAESDAHLYRFAGIYTVALLGLAIIVWLWYLPRRSAYPSSPEKALCTQLAQAEKTANMGDTTPFYGCQGQLKQDSGQKRASLVLAAQSGSSGRGADTGTGLDPVELRKDIVVWNRYEEEFSEFSYGKDLNWYLHSSLRTLVLILSAITPALIVAPMFAKKKFLAALPAAIVAIGTGCIAEFDFKNEAASYGTSRVQLLGEKTAFITRFSPNYLPTPLAQRQQDKTSVEGNCTESQVPFPKPEDYPETRANFACRIQQIFQIRTGERDQFLRGGQPQKSQTATQKSQTATQKSQTATQKSQTATQKPQTATPKPAKPK